MPAAPSNTAADQAASARRFYDRISKAYDLIADSDERAAREQGLVRFHIVIGTDGRVTDCTVTGTSGHASLDEATCALARERFRFVPGRDEYNLPTTDQADYVMTWRLPG